MDLKREVSNLIELKQEGGYWDFKREWHSDKTDLLHDIICFSNNLEDRDAYIIIGVDEKNDYKICDISNDENRKDTQKVVDFLKDKPFAGGIRPVLIVKSIEYNKGTVDVIIIKNTNHTPYYLVNRPNNSKINPNNIYTRIQDTNTPINSSADLDKVEYLWRKRFGLTKTPLDRLRIYLAEPENWINSPQGEMRKYYKFFPEFLIDYRNDDDRDGLEYYLFSQTNYSPKWHDIIIKYHQTVLTEIQGVSLDGGRFFTPVPDIDFIELNKQKSQNIVLRFFIENTFSYALHNFFFKNEFSFEGEISKNNLMEIVLLFKNVQEKEEFKKYVLNNNDDMEMYYSKVSLPYIPEKIDGYKDDIFKEKYRNALIMKEMLDDFRTKYS